MSPGHEHGLTREGARGALAVHEEPARAAAHLVLFHLRDVVRDVVDDVHRRAPAASCPSTRANTVRAVARAPAGCAKAKLAAERIAPR